MDPDDLPLLRTSPGVHLSESDLRPVSDGVSVAAAGSSRDTALHVARATTDCHPEV